PKICVMVALHRAELSDYNGSCYRSPEISLVVLSDFTSDRASTSREAIPLGELTFREREVLKLIAEGHTNNAIAELLHISLRTVQKHRTNLMDKLNIHNIAGLTRTAVKYGLINLE